MLYACTSAVAPAYIMRSAIICGQPSQCSGHRVFSRLHHVVAKSTLFMLNRLPLGLQINQPQVAQEPLCVGRWYRPVPGRSEDFSFKKQPWFQQSSCVPFSVVALVTSPLYIQASFFYLLLVLSLLTVGPYNGTQRIKSSNFILFSLKWGFVPGKNKQTNGPGWIQVLPNQ